MSHAVNQLRHELMTMGWSMIDTSAWLAQLNYHWYPNEKYPGEQPRPRRSYSGDLKAPLKDYVDEMSARLHEALPTEQFYLEDVEARHPTGRSYYHRDGGYLRVLFTIHGPGTWAARSFENNIQTPKGYSLILTGQQRNWAIGVNESWHSAPEKVLSPLHRRLIVLNYRNES